MSIISSNPSADLALLKLNNFDGDLEVLSSNPNSNGYRAFCVGFPSRETYQLKEILLTEL